MEEKAYQDYREPLNPQNLLSTKLISIDTIRIADFKKRNPHIRIDDERLGAREEDLSPKETEAICTTQLAEAAKAVKGSIGNAHSMFRALEECAEQEKNYLILEDDVSLHPNAIDFLLENWEKVSAVDFMALGANTDAPITFEPIFGMKFSGKFLQTADHHPSYRRIEAIFRAYSHAEVSIYKLQKMFGTCAFMVSPTGARKLLSKAFPLDLTPIDIPLLPRRLLGISFDRRINAILESIDARICIPFLAITPNNNKSQR
ncbi:hypothetical protein EBR25_14550 [bacterium]|nr:hypothetical protein [bacterium]